LLFYDSSPAVSPGCFGMEDDFSADSDVPDRLRPLSALISQSEINCRMAGRFPAVRSSLTAVLTPSAPVHTCLTGRSTRPPSGNSVHRTSVRTTSPRAKCIQCTPHRRLRRLCPRSRNRTAWPRRVQPGSRPFGWRPSPFVM